MSGNLAVLQHEYMCLKHDLYDYNMQFQYAILNGGSRDSIKSIARQCDKIKAKIIRLERKMGVTQ